MNKKQIAQAIAKIKKAERRRQPAILASARKVARLQDQARKNRTRKLILLGALTRV